MSETEAEAPVLVIVETQEIWNKEPLAQYQQGSREQLVRRGGVVIARGGELLEGTPPLIGQLIMRWPSAEAFRDWQASEEYAPLKALRQTFMKIRITIIPAV